MKQSMRQAGKALAFFLPAVFGVIGFAVLEGEPLSNALFNCLSMYVINYGDPPANFFVELARWTAPLATASGVFLAMAAVRQKLHNYLCFRRGQSVAVYGPPAARAALLDQLGSNGLEGQDQLIEAQRYILLNQEDWNFGFYYQNRQALQGRTVYLQSRAAPAQAVADPCLRLFCPEETAARLFWKQNCLYPAAAAKQGQLKLVFLGFGTLGEQLLYYGLLDNIFLPDQQIEYHIFGDCQRFLATHTQLDQIEDPIIPHQEPWYQALPLLEQADLVVVLEQQDQLALLRDLLLACRRPRFHVFSASEAAQLLDDQRRLSLFDWQNQAQQLENILGELLFDRAQRINLRYANLYGGVAETQENKLAEWNKLDSFTRYSNVSAADYHEIRLQMLDHMGLPQQPDQWTPETMELFSQLEHIRWHRYHSLHNWRLGTPAQGRKDPVQRIHADLLPYDQLTEGEKEKDRENIRVLLSIQ